MGFYTKKKNSCGCLHGYKILLWQIFWDEYYFYHFFFYQWIILDLNSVYWSKVDGGGKMMVVIMEVGDGICEDGV